MRAGIRASSQCTRADQKVSDLIFLHEEHLGWVGDSWFRDHMNRRACAEIFSAPTPSSVTVQRRVFARASGSLLFSSSVTMTKRNEQRWCIEFCPEVADTQSDTIRKVQETFGDEAMGCRRRWQPQFLF